MNVIHNIIAIIVNSFFLFKLRQNFDLSQFYPSLRLPQFDRQIGWSHHMVCRLEMMPPTLFRRDDRRCCNRNNRLSTNTANNTLHLSTLIILLLAICNFPAPTSGQQYSLQILPSDKSLSKPSNQKFVLTCKGQGGDVALFSNLRWYTPSGEEITNESINPDIKRNYNVMLLYGELYLHFVNPKAEQSGTYSCRGLLQNSESLSSQIDINIYEDVTWEQCPNVQYLIKGNVGERINCKASANPKPKIIWTKGSEQLDNNPRYLINSSGIVIKEATTENDGGVFQINALVTETGATHEKRITVQIYSRPQIVSMKETDWGIEDDQKEMKCESSGMPQPLYSWFDHNRRNLSTVGGYAVDRNTGALTISRLKKNVDEGNFTCIAENYAGKSEKSTSLSVYIRPKIRSFINGSYEQGKTSILECRATGDPLPKLSIRMNGMSRPFVLGDPRIELKEKVEKDESILTLIYQQTARKDDGLYYCRAENPGGISEKTGHIEIKFPPDLSFTPLTKVKTWDSRPVNFTCIADAIPNATIKWFRHGIEIISNEIYRIEDNGSGKSVMFVTPTKLSYDNQAFGTYQCEASNSLGKNYINIDLERALVPGPVTQVQTVAITPTQVRFRMQNDLPDGGLPIKKIIAEYYPMFNPTDRRTKDLPYSNNAENVYNFDYLLPLTDYGFRFVAVNEVGKGDSAGEIRIRTHAESKPDRPTFHNLQYDSISKTDVVSQYPHKFTAMWNIPSDNGRKIQYFEIKYYPVKKTEFGVTALSPPRIERISLIHDEATQRTLTRLKANTFYRLELIAYNELGASEEASVIFKTAASFADADDDYDDFSELTVSSIPIGLIAGAAILGIIFILLLMDIFFYVRYKVGAIYFLRTHICNVGHEDENKLSNFSPSLSPTEITSAKAQLRYTGRGVALPRTEPKTVEMDNPAFDYPMKHNFEEQSPMLSERERERFAGYRNDHDSTV